MRPSALGGYPLDSFVVSAPAGLVILDSNLCVVQANEAMAEMVGTSPQEIIGHDPRFLVPKLAPTVEPLLRHVLGTREPILNLPISGETPKEPGVTRNWMVSIFPAGDLIRAIVVEVTDSVQLQRVSRSERLLAEAECLAKLGSWETDQITGEGRWSPNLCALLDLDSSQTRFTEDEFWQLLHPDDRTRVRAIIARSVEERRPSEYQARFVLRNGRERVLLTRGTFILDSAGHVLKRVGVTQDITDRIETERALRESEERYRDLVENSRDLICLHDLEGRLLWMNELPARILGYSSSQLIGRPVQDMLEPHLRDEYDAYIETIRRDGHARGLMKVVARSGERRIWEYQNTLRKDAPEGPIVRGMAHDVTELKRAERALRLLAAQLLVSQDQDRRRIAQALQEETAQDLTGVKMSLGHLARFAGAGLLPRAVAVINESEELVRTTLDHIRTLSNELHPPLLELVGLWPTVASYAARFGKSQGIAVSVEIPERMERLPAEREIVVFRIIQECLANIRRHSGSTRATIRALTDTGRLLVEVADFGKGFSGNADAPVTSGLGITGMRERARHLGGELKIETRPQAGTTVRLSIPISPSSQAGAVERSR